MSLLVMLAFRIFDGFVAASIFHDIAQLRRAEMNDPTKLPRAIARWWRRPR